MAFLILLLISKLIFCKATYFSTSSKFFTHYDADNRYIIMDNEIPERDFTNYRLSNNIIPNHYYIYLDLSNMKDDKISSIFGKIDIDLRIGCPTKTINFHAQRPYVIIRNYKLLRYRFNSEKMDLITDLVEKSYNPSSHIFTLYFDKELIPGYYTLEMEFDCNANKTKSLFQTTYINGKGETKWIAATHFQGIGARQVFPCWDEPGFRSTFNISIKCNSKYVVLSNTLMVKLDRVASDIMLREFNTTSPIPAHFVAFAIFDPDAVYLISDSKWVPSHLKFAQNVAKKMRKILSHFSYISSLEQKHLAIPNFPDNVMINWGLNFYRLSDVIYEEGKDPVMRKIEVARLIAWGMMQEYIGNIISPSWWSSLWLNDGINMLFATEKLNKVFEDTQIMDLYAVEYQYESFHLDCGFLKPLTSKIVTPSEINSLFSYPRYAKAITILNMLRNVLIDYYSKTYVDVFPHGYIKYFQTFLFKAANFDDFWKALESAQREMAVPKQFIIVRQIMNDWITQPEYPVLNVIEYNKTINKVIGLSEKFNVSRIDYWISFLFNTKVEILEQNYTALNKNTWQQTSDKSMKVVEFSLKNYESEEENVKRLLNLSIKGYFRVSYDVPTWNRIIDLLVSHKQIELPIITKTKLIDDAFHFVVARKLNSTIFWKMSQFLKVEPNYIVWYPMFKALEYISRILPLLTGPLKKIKKHMQFLHYVHLTKSFNNFEEFKSIQNYTLSNCLDQEIAKWACILNYAECILTARTNLIHHIINPSKYKILPWWKKWIFCYGIHDNYPMWEKILEYEHTITDQNEKSKIVEFLCCTKNIGAIKFILRMAQEKKFYGVIVSNLSVKDSINIFSLIVAKHARNYEILDYILFNFNELKPREISTVAALINIINHVYFTEQLEQVFEFMNNNNLNKLIIEQKIKTRWVQLQSLHNDYHILL